MSLVPFVFAARTAPIPLSELDANFLAIGAPDWKIVSDYNGNVTDGSIDSTAAVLAAIAALPATGGVVYFPAGTFKLASAVLIIRSGIHLMGAGIGATLINYTATSGDAICFGTAVVAVGNGGISHMSITAASAMVSGSLVRFRSGHELYFRNAIIVSNAYVGIALDGGTTPFLYTIREFEVNSGSSAGIALGNDLTNVSDVWISDGIIAGCAGAGILLKRANGVYFTNLDVITSGDGIKFFPDVGHEVANMFCSQVLADTCVRHGWTFTSNGGYTHDITLTGCWGSTNGSPAGTPTDSGYTGMAFLHANVYAITLLGPRCVNNGGNGIYLAAGRDITIIAPNCITNSRAVNNLKDGIEVAAAVSNWSIIGGVCGVSGSGVFAANQQRYGISVVAGASDFYSIIDVNCIGNVTGTILNSATGVNRVVITKEGSSLFSGMLSTAALGYTTGSGGTVAQVTSKATGVTLNKLSGQITTNAANLAAGAKISFTVTNSFIASANDIPVVCVSGGGTAQAYRVNVTKVVAGAFDIMLENATAGALAEAPVIGFNVIRGVNA